jgi:1,4-dihydroxy-2-naphthoate octaprenyltransferase
MDVKTFAVAVRLPFVTASALPVILSVLWTAFTIGTFNLLNAVICVFGVIIVHIGANTINDYYDWNFSDGVNRYAGQFNGGSRHVFEGTISRKFYLYVALCCFAILIAIAIYFMLNDCFNVLYFSLAGLLLGYLYSSPPFRFHSRGLGEILILLAFGPVLCAGVCYVMSGSVALSYFLIGIPSGLATAAILWINQFPDYEADKAAGKRNLTVRIGLEKSVYIYVCMIGLVFLSVLLLILLRLFPLWTAFIVLLIPGCLRTQRLLFSHYASPDKLVPAQAFTIQFQMISTVILIAGILIHKWIPLNLP